MCCCYSRHYRHQAESSYPITALEVSSCRFDAGLVSTKLRYARLRSQMPAKTGLRGRGLDETKQHEAGFVSLRPQKRALNNLQLNNYYFIIIFYINICSYSEQVNIFGTI